MWQRSIKWLGGATIAVICFSLLLNIFGFGLSALNWTAESALNGILAGIWVATMLGAMLFSKNTTSAEKKIVWGILAWVFLYGLTSVVTRPVSISIHVLGLVIMLIVVRIARSTE